MRDHAKIEPGRALTNSVDNGFLPRHRWYPIKEGFSAQLVADSIAELNNLESDSTLAIEPFSGSGTTPVECSRLGIECLAFEVNPFLAFVGQTKLLQLDPNRLQSAAEIVLMGLNAPIISPLEEVSTFCEGKKKSKWLFNKSVLRSYAGGWNSTLECTPTARALLRLALVRAAMDNCNAYPDGKCLRYKRMDNYECYNRDFLANRFEHYVQIMKEDLASTPFRNQTSKVTCKDSRKIGNANARRQFDLCITSPPYLNSFDYSDVYRPELFLSGLITDNEQLMKLRLKTLRSHVQAKWPKPVSSNFGTLYAKAVKELKESQIKLWSPRIPEMIQAYFEDMEQLLNTLAQRANPNALLKIAVSTSAYGGVVIPVDFILAEIAESVGWQLKDVEVVRRLRSSAQNWKHGTDAISAPALRESLVILRHP